MTKGEHFKDDYLNLNPEHCIPTLIDTDGFVIWDSHSICAYLMDKYGKDDSLYPKDLQLRARCNQRMFFDAASLFVRLRDCTVHVLRNGGKELTQNFVDPIYAAYEILEAFLAKDPFLVGNKLTIADISVMNTVLSIEIYAPLKSDKYPKILAWLKRSREAIPFFDELKLSDIEEYRTLITKTMEKNRQN